jgi:hypothetical protein
VYLESVMHMKGFQVAQDDRPMWVTTYCGIRHEADSEFEVDLLTCDCCVGATAHVHKVTLTPGHTAQHSPDQIFNFNL